MKRFSVGSDSIRLNPATPGSSSNAIDAPGSCRGKVSPVSEVTKAPKVIAAIARVMAEVGAVGKTKKNQAQGYQFRGVDDVVAHVQEVMAKCGLVVIPRVVEREREMLASKSGGSMVSVRLLVEHTFYCEEDGSSVVCTTLGEAMDSGDKASNKAMSAALKYCLTESLLIPTYEVDRDTEEHSPQVAPPAPKPVAPPTSRHVTRSTPPTALEISDAREILRKAPRGFMAPEMIAEAEETLRAAGQTVTAVSAPPSPPSNVRPITQSHEVAIAEWAQKFASCVTFAELEAAGKELAKSNNMALRKACGPAYNMRAATLRSAS